MLRLVSLSDSDLDLIEKNRRTPLIQRLIWQVRQLRDLVACLEADAEDARGEHLYHK